MSPRISRGKACLAQLSPFVNILGERSQKRGLREIGRKCVCVGGDRRKRAQCGRERGREQERRVT